MTVPSPLSLLSATALSALMLVVGACAKPEARPVEATAPVVAEGAKAVGPFVSAANPHAVAAGMTVLERGGTAADAAVAVQAVLGLVEPQSSGLGGGAFMMWFDAESGTVTVYDGRETAPAAATPDLFWQEGRPLGFAEAVLSGRSTGVPGVVAMLGLAQTRHGRLAWADLFGDAERLAEDGFEVSPRLGGFIAATRGQARSDWANAYFTGADGKRVQTGDILTNRAYAETVRALAAGGSRALYEGPIAEGIVATVGQAPLPGPLTLEDMAGYQPKVRGPLCRPYRIYVVCVPPPPSSGVSLLQLLAMAEHVPEVSAGPDDAGAWVAFARLQRLMYADRDRYVADADFVYVPVAGLLDPGYVAGRAALVPGLTGAAEAGHPPGIVTVGTDATVEPAGTSHFFIVDQWGNAVSMTTTVESVFGSGRMSGGFFLNNQLTDFSFEPVDDLGRPVANAVAGGKRPRSSMAPVLIFDREGRLVGGLGSPGGSSILAYNAKALIGTLDWGLGVQDAFDLPNLVARGTGLGADTERFSPALQAALAAQGLHLRPNASENSGLHGGLWRLGPDGWAWDGGADDRREGVVATR
ncbi:gamma-glutamyltransferase family protein [Brevundimonas sp.]|uniref:gamma-glutamyltransferase family protein n=1 Tax=Brevundimonas sp. TaxID=1871086 RepID=UPI001D2BEF1F|nr:gamma-glutamyltransferase family protein [Brevundimonas sp.]MBL0948777.1 gamma-glutamyltransferase family protein [Brevundimonas sp.]